MGVTHVNHTAALAWPNNQISLPMPLHLRRYVANAAVHGDSYSWHVDADPSTLPYPSPWTLEYGQYVNRVSDGNGDTWVHRSAHASPDSPITRLLRIHILHRMRALAFSCKVMKSY